MIKSISTVSHVDKHKITYLLIGHWYLQRICYFIQFSEWRVCHPLLWWACRQFFWPVINSSLTFPRMLKDFNVWKFMNASMFKNTWLGHWHLLHKCCSGVVGLSFLTYSRILFCKNISTIKYLFMKDTYETKMTNSGRSSCGPIYLVPGPGTWPRSGSSETLH